MKQLAATIQDVQQWIRLNGVVMGSNELIPPEMGEIEQNIDAWGELLSIVPRIFMRPESRVRSDTLNAFESLVLSIRAMHEVTERAVKEHGLATMLSLPEWENSEAASGSEDY